MEINIPQYWGMLKVYNTAKPQNLVNVIKYIMCDLLIRVAVFMFPISKAHKTGTGGCAREINKTKYQHIQLHRCDTAHTGLIFTIKHIHLKLFCTAICRGMPFSGLLEGLTAFSEETGQLIARD